MNVPVLVLAQVGVCSCNAPLAQAGLKKAIEPTTGLSSHKVKVENPPATTSFNVHGVDAQAFCLGAQSCVSDLHDGVALRRPGLAFMGLLDGERLLDHFRRCVPG